jgi:N-acetylmuramoyl-L-alanine amidase
LKAISLVVVHATATAGIDSPLTWICSKESGVSAHYLIGLDGEVHHLVHESNVAWHAGVSVWKGIPNVNDYSVGIELVNDNTGTMPYPQAQLDACSAMVKAIAADYNLTTADVVGHLDIAPGRKTDPANFPWKEFRDSLSYPSV